jgi:hypothetical protein
LRRQRSSEDLHAFLHEPDDGLGRIAIQVGGGFIGQDELRMGHKGPRDGDALFLAARKLIGSFFCWSSMPTASRSPRIRSLRVEAGTSCTITRGYSTFSYRKDRDQVEALEDKADMFASKPGPVSGAEACHLYASNKETASRGFIKAPHEIEQGGFPAFPLPEGPMKDTKAPFSIEKLTPFKAGAAASPVP